MSLVRCLIVDDSEEFLASVSQFLRAQGVEVVACASSGLQALELVSSLAPDVALVDVELGEEDGIALAAELAARAPSTRVVLISSYERDDLGELIALDGSVEFLPKSAIGSGAIARLLG